MTVDLTSEVAAYLAGPRCRALPEGVAERTKIHILDTVAAVVSGGALLAGIRGTDAHHLLGGNPEAMIVATGDLTGSVAAALANGMAAHADETDDSHAPSFSHPGCATVPAALAAGERAGVSGTHFMAAVAAGYDVGSRVGMALGPQAIDARRSGPSSHSVVATFGAAAASAVVDSLDREQCAAVLSYAAQQASGVTTWQRDTEHVEKAFVFAGRPAAAGVLSASVVRRGWTAVRSVFDGRLNFLEALSSEPQPGLLIDGLGERFEVTRTNIKRYCVGSPAQAAVQAAEELIEEAGIVADAVELIEVALPADLAGIVDGRELPDINVQYLVAVTLLDRRLTFAAAHDTARMGTPEVSGLIARTDLVADEKSAGTRSARLRIRLRDGAVYHREVQHVRGTADSPMEWGEVADKALDLTGPRLGAHRAGRLVEALRTLDSLNDVRDLRDLLRPA